MTSLAHRRRMLAHCEAQERVLAQSSAAAATDEHYARHLRLLILARLPHERAECIARACARERIKIAASEIT